MPQRKPNPPWRVMATCKRQKCKKSFLKIQSTQIYCCIGCRVADCKRRKGEVLGHIQYHPTTGKLILTITLPPEVHFRP